MKIWYLDTTCYSFTSYYNFFWFEILNKLAFFCVMHLSKLWLLLVAFILGARYEYYTGLDVFEQYRTIFSISSLILNTFNFFNIIRYDSTPSDLLLSLNANRIDSPAYIYLLHSRPVEQILFFLFLVLKLLGLDWTARSTSNYSNQVGLFNIHWTIQFTLNYLNQVVYLIYFELFEQSQSTSRMKSICVHQTISQDLDTDWILRFKSYEINDDNKTKN